MSESEFGKKKPLWFRMLLPLLKMKKLPELPDNPKTGKWYRVYPEGCIDAEGEQTYAHFSQGKENKLIVFFCGGGFSINEYTAARPMKIFEGGDMNDMYYMVGLDMISDAVPKGGIMQNKEPNPFADWSKLYITYNTGDFHVGNNDYPYTALDGSKQILHHHGYKNYRAIMEVVKKYIPNPESMIVTGCSAGAYGTAMLADDVMNQFPQCQNVVCLVDSALCISTEFHDIAEKVWGAPNEIVDRIQSDNFVLDSLVALSRKQGERVKCLFTSSVRDGSLVRMQNYMDMGKLIFTKEGGEYYQKNYAKMCKQMQELIPNSGIFAYEIPDYSNKEMNLTVHCIIGEKWFYKKEVEGITCVKWIEDALNQKVKSYGLKLLNR